MGENEDILKQIEELKKRMEKKESQPVDRKKQIKVHRVTTEKRDYYEEPKKEEPVDPVSKYLGGDSATPNNAPGAPHGGQQQKKPSKDYIHKRIAANEVHIWLNKSLTLFLVNIVGLMVFYFLLNLAMALVADVVMFALVGINAFFLMTFRKHQIYLQRRYNITPKRGMFSGMGIPKQRQWNQRGPNYNENPQQQQYEDYTNEGDAPW